MKRDDHLRRWAEAIAAEYPISAVEILELHRGIMAISPSLQSWRIPWLLRELAAGRFIGFITAETVAPYAPQIVLVDDLPQERTRGHQHARGAPAGALRSRAIDAPSIAVLAAIGWMQVDWRTAP